MKLPAPINLSGFLFCVLSGFLAACASRPSRDAGLYASWFAGETPANHETAEQDAAEAALRRKIAQMLLTGFRGTELRENSRLYRDIGELGIGGVLLFDYDIPSRSRPRNILSKEQLLRLNRDMQSIAPVPLFIAVDQEGGRVNRLRSEYGFPPNLSAADMALDPGGAVTAAQAEQTAALLAETGVNLNFAPCVDLNTNPANPVIGAYGRSFSGDPETVVRHAEIWIAAARRYGVISCIKHFPGHGSSSGDTHLGSVDITASWDEAELVPYRRLLGDASGNSLMVMTSHVFNARLDPRHPATLSAPVLTGLLRNKLGYLGIIVSDDLDMAAVKGNYSFEETLEKAVNAGVDILCLSNNGDEYDPLLAQRALDILYNLVKERKIPRKRIEESWRRIMLVKNALGESPAGESALL